MPTHDEIVESRIDKLYAQICKDAKLPMTPTRLARWITMSSLAAEPCKLEKVIAKHGYPFVLDALDKAHAMVKKVLA